MKKMILGVVLCISALFILINATWYVWRMMKYGSYNTNMGKNVFSTWIVPRYMQTDADGYDYSVKYPDYLMLTGNMGVTCPATDDNMYTDGLIIWPKLFGDYEYGVVLYENGERFCIYINADGSVIDSEDNEVLARHQENVDNLLYRAKEKWDLE